MPSSTQHAITLDASTLLVVSTCITALLGLFLLFAWSQDRIRALAWWGSAYLLGGFSVALWSLDKVLSGYLPVSVPNALLFFACGMVWNAARLFHGRPVLFIAMGSGALAWLLACNFEVFLTSLQLRIVLSALIVAAYTFLTAYELWRERRKTLLRRWPAVFVPILHSAVFLLPIPLAAVLPAERGVVTLASGWMAVFAIEIMLYAVGTAFIVLVLTKDQTVRNYKAAAATDMLTGVFNRRAFFEAAERLIASGTKSELPVSVLLFDLDRFKAINDCFGHAAGDETLRTFASAAIGAIRSTDFFGRLGGEEFAMIMIGGPQDATVVGERVRLAFASCGVKIAGHTMNATVSVGIASATGRCTPEQLLNRADAALYRAKANGRNCLEVANGADVVDLAQATKAAASAEANAAEAARAA